MEQESLPEYRRFFQSYHASYSGAIQTMDEHILKLYLRKEYKMNFPFAARPRAGQIVQGISDLRLGLDDYSPINGPKEGMELSKAVTKGMAEFMTYQPRDWDGGKDMEEYRKFRECIPEMAAFAVAGLQHYFGGDVIEGEYEIRMQPEKLDVPVIMFIDYQSADKMIDLKCSFPLRNPPRKDGSRSWRSPKPKTEPTDYQVAQQAVYWKATGLAPALLFVTPSGWNIADQHNCMALREDNLERVYAEIERRWLVQQNVLRAADQSWENLFGLVNPDFGQLAGRHGPEILRIAKEAWR